MPRYFLITIGLFWIPSLLLWLYLRKKLSPLEKKSLWITIAVIAPASCVMEYVYLWTHIWTFSEQLDPLLGIWIAGAPIEEFFFWVGAAVVMPLLYLWLDHLRPKRAEKEPARA